MIEIICEAKCQLLRTVRTKSDAFIVLASLNLLNAVVKKKGYKDIVSYGLIKPNVVKFILQCIESDQIKFIDEVYYDIKGQCIYIRCYGIQFSFHNICIHNIDNFVHSPQNEKVDWDGVRLQPIAFELFGLAYQNLTAGEMTIDNIQNEVKRIVKEKELNV